MSEKIYELGNTNWEHWYPDDSYINVGVCFRPDKNDVADVITPACSCRESTINYLGRDDTLSDTAYPALYIILASGRVSQYDYEEDIKRRKQWSKEGVEGLKSGIRILNILERKFNWALSRMYELDLKGAKDNGIIGRLVVGSNRWFRSPQMLSLYILLLRSPLHITALSKVDGRTTFNSLMRLFGSDSPEPNYCEDGVYYVWKVAPFLPLIMSSYTRLFKGKRRSGWFTQLDRVKDVDGRWKERCEEYGYVYNGTREALPIAEEGIDTFLDAYSDYDGLTKRLRKYVKESIDKGELNANDPRVKRIMEVQDS